MIVISGYYICIFILVGMFFHTSPDPIIFNKYSPAYLVLILAFSTFSLFLKKTLFILSKESHITLKSGNTIRLSPVSKIVFYLFLLILCLTPYEFYLRYNQKNKGRDFKESFHPFLQNKLNRLDKRFHINSFGFRGDEIEKAKPKDTFRIFVVGGSTVLSHRTPHEKSHVRLLEKLLKKYYRQKKIEVVNAGGEWHTSAHSLSKYLFWIKDFNPDMIILWHGINDLYRSFSPEGYAYGEFKSDYSHFYGPISDMVFAHSEKLDSKPFFTVNSRLLDLLYETNPIFSDFREEKIKSILEGTSVNNFQSLDPFARNLVSFVKNVRADNVKLILATQPYLYRNNLGERELNSIFFPQIFCRNSKGEYPDLKSMIHGMELFNDKTRSIAKEYDVPLIDLEKSIPKMKELFRDDVHYTNDGNLYIAHDIYKYIILNKLIVN